MKKVRLPLSFPLACAAYLLAAAVCVLPAVLCRRLGTVPSMLCSVVLTALLLLIIRCCSGLAPLKEGKYFSKYLPLVLLFPALYLVVRPISGAGGLTLSEFLPWCACLLTEVLWEELLFRYGAQLLYGRRELFRLRTLIPTAVIFGAGAPLLLLRFAPVPYGNALAVCVALCAAVFLTALQLRTKNVLVPMTAHFLMRFTAEFTDRFSSGSGAPEDGLLSALLLCALPLVIGGILISRGRRAELKK